MLISFNLDNFLAVHHFVWKALTFDADANALDP